MWDEKPIHTPESFGTKPYALVRLVNNGTELYVRLSWFHRVQLARRAEADTVLLCFYSPNLSARPNFRYHFHPIHAHGFQATWERVYEVNVIQIVEGNLKHRTILPAEKSSVPDISEGPVSKEIHSSHGEKKLAKALEKAKSVQARVSGLAAICDVLLHNYLPEACAAEATEEAIFNLIERSLQRGKDAEREYASQLVALLALQLGNCDKLASTMRPLLLQTVQDSTATATTRAQACSALAVTLVVIDKCTVDCRLQSMRAMEAIFAGAHQRTVNADVDQLHLAALQAWAVLFTQIPAADFSSVMMHRHGGRHIPSIKRLKSLLQSPNQEIRLATGEAIALILEAQRQNDNDSADAYTTALANLLEQLSTEKGGLKSQRSNFRNILLYVALGEFPETTITFDGESLVINCWKMHILSAALVRTIGCSASLQLSKNPVLRKRFGLDSGEIDVTNKDRT